MKRERRHELEKNELADWIASLVAKIKPYQNAILGVVLLLAVGGAVYAWMSRRAASEAGAAWDDLNAVMLSGATNPADFDGVAANHPGTTTADWATVLAAEGYLTRGCDELFVSKEMARDDLKKAEKRFREVLDRCRVDTLRERATYGLAQTDEAAGDLAKARESWSSPALKESGQKADRGYQGVVNLWPGGTYATMARRRLEDLQRTSTKQFYDEFAKWEPKSPSAEGAGAPGVRPSTDLTVPDEKPLYTPGELTKPEAGKAKPSGFPEPAAAKKPAPAPAKKPAASPAPKEKPSKAAP